MDNVSESSQKGSPDQEGLQLDGAPHPSNIIPFSSSECEVVINPTANPESVVVFVCDEEPHMIEDEKARGYIPLRFGDVIPSRRTGNSYEIVRKLDWSIHSSVWLACVRRASPSDASEKRTDPGYVVVKVLTIQATRGELCRDSWELDVASLLNTAIRAERPAGEHPGHTCCVTVQDVCIAESPHGRHLCLVMAPFGQSVDELRLAQQPARLPLKVVKRVVMQTLRALDFLHTRAQVVHCDVKLANLFIKIDASASQISAYLQESPSECYPTRHNSQLWPHGPIITAKSQPLPNFGLDPSLENIQVCLGDYGSAVPLSEDRSEDSWSTPPALRAPEQILGGPWSTSIDIWAVGCMVLDSLIGSGTFHIYRTADGVMNFEDVHLSQIADLVGPYPETFLTRCGRRDEFFDVQGHPRRTTPNRYSSVELRLSGVLQREDDIAATSAFVRRCLTVDPSSRPTAAELLQDEWFSS